MADVAINWQYSRLHTGPVSRRTFTISLVSRVRHLFLEMTALQAVPRLLTQPNPAAVLGQRVRLRCYDGRVRRSLHGSCCRQSLPCIASPEDIKDPRGIIRIDASFNKLVFQTAALFELGVTSDLSETDSSQVRRA